MITTKFLDAAGVKYLWEQLQNRTDAVIQKYSAVSDFPEVGKEHTLYLVENEFTLYAWYNNNYAVLEGIKFILITSSEGTFTPAELEILNNNYTKVMIAHQYLNEEADVCYNLYQLNLRAGNKWTYLTKEIKEIEVEINEKKVKENVVYFKNLNVNMLNGLYSIEVPYSLIDHINNPEVHLQKGERVGWNKKVSATVAEEVLTLEVGIEEN